MKTTIVRDTNYSFLKTVTRESGESFTRKLEKGTSEYSNACAMFHQRNVELALGNSISF